MAANTYKVQEEQEQAVYKDGKTIFQRLDHLVKLNDLFGEGLPIQYLPKILFLSTFLIFYIGNAHFAERKVRQIEKMKIEVEDIRADYTTLKADLMFASKQSEVARKVEILGLEETHEPPNKIVED